MGCKCYVVIKPSIRQTLNKTNRCQLLCEHMHLPVCLCQKLKTNPQNNYHNYVVAQLSISFDVKHFSCCWRHLVTIILFCFPAFARGVNVEHARTMQMTIDSRQGNFGATQCGAQWLTKRCCLKKKFVKGFIPESTLSVALFRTECNSLFRLKPWSQHHNAFQATDCK